MITLLGRKKGMGGVFDSQGRHVAVTVLEVGPCPVVQVKTSDNDGYKAVQIAFDPMREYLANKPMTGHFKRVKLQPHRLLKEFHYDGEDLKPGDVLKSDFFKPGDMVIVSGTSKGRGFAGVIKRHNFSRPVQSHGTHETFRGPGSIGSHSYPARVFPGKRMAGHLGNENVTVKNLVVVAVDHSKGFIMVRGAVPGPQGSYISLRKASRG